MVDYRVYHRISVLRNIAELLGTHIRRDNSTRWATKTDGARIRVEMDATQEPLKGFWIGNPDNPSTIFQEVFTRTCRLFVLDVKCKGIMLKPISG